MIFGSTLQPLVSCELWAGVVNRILPPMSEASSSSESFMGDWGALVVLCLTLFIVVLDTSMMNVAVPQITQDLSTTVSSVQSVIAL